MHLSDADIAHLGKLARLDLTASQRQLFAEQLSAVLDYLDQINQGDAAHVAAHVPRRTVTPYDLREDVAAVPSSVDLAAQAPHREGRLVASPPTT
ncbi:MAG: Asp-tRNA(Asn)/Glu-tRNA(Gln) amidotransferase subunit GatC [bacterium]|nr:Asp-tRNA(Asn)/Glu-tRNA(Gln) amidotransferase subunit GatC [bacterium]